MLFASRPYILKIALLKSLSANAETLVGEHTLTPAILHHFDQLAIKRVSVHLGTRSEKTILSMIELITLLELRVE